MTKGIGGRLQKAEAMLNPPRFHSLIKYEDETDDDALAREGINPGPDDLVVYVRLFQNLDGTFSHPCDRGET